MDFYAQRGRLPIKGELESENEAEIRRAFGNLSRAFQVVLQVTKQEEWDEIREQRHQELLLYLALSRFGHRSDYSKLNKKRT